MSSDAQPSSPAPQRRCVLVCQYRSCLRSRSDQVLAAFNATSIPGVFVTGSGCLGQCGSGPTVQVMPDGTWYCRVAPEQVSVIIEQHLRQNKPVKPLMHPRFHPRNSFTEE